MLMLKSQWLRNSNECDVEYTTPLEKCKDDYYQLKLDSIWTQTPETKPVVVPVNYEVYDICDDLFLFIIKSYHKLQK